VRREPCAAASAKAAALDDVEQPLAADRPPSEALTVLSQRFGAAVEPRSGEQAWAAGPLDSQRQRVGRSENGGRGHPSGPEVTSRPVIDGPLPNIVITRRVPLQTA
jgi:hypothetical protein